MPAVVIGDRQFVYVASAKVPTKFVEHDVRIGRAVGDRIEVLAGLSAGDSAVSKGRVSSAVDERSSCTTSQPRRCGRHPGGRSLESLRKQSKKLVSGPEVRSVPKAQSALE